MSRKSPSDRVALIVAPATIWRDALVSLVRAQPKLHVGFVLDTLEDVRAVLSNGAVDIVIAESGADERALFDFLAWLSEHHDAVRRVVAVDTQIQQVRFLRAGAQATLLKGCLDGILLRSAVDTAG